MARLLAGLTLAVVFLHVETAFGDSSCRYLPGDAEWPGQEEWNQLNASVSGRLIAAVPPGSVCHDPNYDEAACAALQQTWVMPETQFNTPAGFMSPYHQNESCIPFTARNSTCLQGNYVQYAIDVTEAADVQAGLKFAQEKNIRLVVKNTGHDYLAKSTGKGALSLWMHNLKSITFSNFTSDAYSGPAVKMGAGVQAYEAYIAADKVGLNVVGGQCPTVGLTGGYTQGGGHSTLSSVYGLGADQTLEWEVVTANGTVVTATPNKNTDLYWALSGGGGGTYGVALSLISRAYPDRRMGGATLQFAAASNDDDKLWDAVAFFQETSLPTIADRGAHVQWAIAGPAFVLSECTIPGATEDDMREAFSSFTQHLDSLGFQYQLNVTSYSTFKEHADVYLSPLNEAPASQIQGGVMISRSTVSSNNTGLTSTLRHIATTYPQFYIASYGLDVSKQASYPNAVNPAWRDTLIYYVVFQFWNFTVPYSAMAEQERILTEDLMPPLQDMASGAYLSEADFHNPRWREEFYGGNWERLNSIKKAWDPTSLFYATTAVGSDEWTVQGDGRLCKSASSR